MKSCRVLVALGISSLRTNPLEGKLTLNVCSEHDSLDSKISREPISASISFARHGSMFRNRPGLRRLLLKLSIRIMFAIVVVIASIRDYLLGDGLYIYRDWSWPLSTNLFP